MRGVRPTSLRGLQSLVEIMRTGSATAAARELGLSQPAVSRLIAQLEGEVGFELFYRDRGRLVPTADGRALAEEAEMALTGIERVNSLIRDIAEFATGELRLVAPPSFSESILPDICAAFLRRYPNVRLSIDSRSIETTKTMIATRVADGGFIKLPIDRDDLHAETVVSSGTACVLTADQPLAAETTLTPALLRGVPLVLLGQGRQSRSQIEHAFAECGVRPTVAAETHTIGSACALAARGIGVAIVNALLARGHLGPPLRAVPFAPAISQDYAFVTSALSRSTRLTVAFREEVRSYFEKLKLTP